MTVDEMITRFSPEQDKICHSVRAQMKEVKCFELEGQLFKGNPFHAALMFAYNNPTGGDFYVWVQDNYKRIAPVG